MKRIDDVHIMDRSRIFRLRFEKGLVSVLFVCVVIFSLSKRIPVKPARLPKVQLNSDILIDDIPITRSGKRATAPARPVVPIPSEDETIPEDETIDITDFSFEFDVPSFGMGGADGSGDGAGKYAPRPIREAIPDFPESERKKGLRGIVELKILVNMSGRVDSVIVLSNTTGSKRLAQSAKNAAYRSLYRPIKNPSKIQSYWLTRPYRFESD